MSALIYPAAEPQPLVERLHGMPVADPYRWLEDATSAQTRRWLDAQQELWQAHAAALSDRDAIHTSVAALTDTGSQTPPIRRGSRLFFLRHSAGQQHPVLVAVPDGGQERVLLDPSTLNPDGLSTLDAWQPDLSGTLLAYQVSRRGTENAELFVRDIDSGELLDGPIGGCRYSPVAWLPSGAAFYYVRDTAAGGRAVFLHRLGTPPDSDVLVLGADLPGDTGYGVELGKDGRWLVLAASRPGAPGNDLWLADLTESAPEAPALRVVQQATAASTVCTVGADGMLYVVTTVDAPRGRLCVADPHRPRDWRTLVAEDAEAVLANFTVAENGRLVLARTRRTISELTVHDSTTGALLETIPLPGAGTVGGLSVTEHGALWFSYTDNLTPITVYRYDPRRRECVPVRRDGADRSEALDTAKPVTRQRVCRSADGTQVQLVICAPQHTDRPLPTIIYSYGGFGAALTPTFSSFALTWVLAGGVFVTANPRGGGEGGADWHRAGMLECKQNSFDDVIAVAEYLIDNGWTTPGQLAITGESNGGLLAGAAITQRPDLFAAAVCSAPVLDMVRYERFGLGSSWAREYGSAADPAALRWLLDYSPYHRVRSNVDYPAVLFTVFDGDTRVDPLHARKMCAALQAASTSGRPVLLRTESGVGHAARAADRATAMSADMLAFLAGQTGLDPGALR